MGYFWTIVLDILVVCLLGLSSSDGLEVVQRLDLLPPYVDHVTLPVTRGEAAFWDVDSQALYFIDIEGPAIYRYHPLTDTLKFLTLDTEISFFVLIEGYPDKFLVSMGKDLVVLTWDYVTGYFDICLLTTVEQFIPGNRWNDGGVDLSGVVWAGTKGAENSMNQVVPCVGTLYRLDGRKKYPRPVPVMSPVSNSNGLVFTSTPNGTVMYYVDSPTRQVEAFDVDMFAGSLSNRRTVFTFGSLPGNPDGVIVDTEGNLWIAANGGNMVLQVNPTTGLVLQKVYIPSVRVDSLSFGGPLLTDLYVTTQLSNVNASLLRQYPLAGAVFRVTLTGAKGVPKNKAVINSAKCMKKNH